MKRIVLFSLLKKRRLNNEQGKIELVKCPRQGNSCKDHLPEINRSYKDFYTYYKNKEYVKSIETLKGAFYKTMDLQESPCARCGEFFRATIKNSIENVHDELKGLSRGLYRPKRYASSFLMASNVLQEVNGISK